MVLHTFTRELYPADTITSNHCITSIVSTDTCDTSVFDDLLSSAWGVYSFEQQVLGAPKYKDVNGIDDVDYQYKFNL